MPIADVMIKRLGIGGWIALGGAVLLFASTFMAWYAVRLPDAFGDQLREQLQQSNSPFGQSFGNAIADDLTNRNLTTLTAWRAFDGWDLLIVAVALVACALVVVRGVGAARGADAGRLLRGLGGVAAFLVIARMISRPDPSQVMQLDTGIYVALGAAIAIAIGGFLMPATDRSGASFATDAFAITPSAPGTTPEPGGSVPPPVGR